MYPSRLARPAPVPSWRLVHELREHWLFAVIVACGTALRVVVQVAYQQAFIFPDSERYLQYASNFIAGNWSPDWLRASGYSLLLMPAVLTHNLSVVVAIQHLLGLATAVLIYATLIHFGARRWLAVLATIPVLFDPLQLNLEQYILTDVCATFLVFLALVVLVWRRDALGKGAALTAGLLVAAATIIRESDLLVMIPALLYVVAVIRPRRRCANRAGLLFIGCAIPVIGYLAWVQVWFGTFNFVTYSNQFLYGRIVQFADCNGLSLPWYERQLCPTQPPAKRDLDWYMWAPHSPQVLLQPTAGLSKGQIIHDFNSRIIDHQPLSYVEAVARDALYSFSPVRGNGPERYPKGYHDFHTYFPSGKGELATLRAYTGSTGRVQPALAAFLTGYGRDFYVPGPLLAAGLVLGLAGTAGLARARRSKLRGPSLLFSLGTIAMIFPPFIIATFDWRYEIPQFYLIPVAAVLGVLAMADRGGDSSPAPAGTDQGEWETSARSRSAEAVSAVRRGSDRGDAPDLPDDHTGPPA